MYPLERSLVPAHILIAAIINAGLVVFAVEAVVRAALGRVLFPEMVKSAETGHALIFTAREPIEQVEVVAALCQQHRRGLVLSAPVAAHIAVREMPIGDVFVVLDEHYLAQRARIDYLLDTPVIRGVAQNMAHEHLRALFPRLFLDGEALFYVGADRLFEQQVISQLERLHGVTVMIPVLSGDDHQIRHFPLREKRLVVREAGAVGHAPRALHLVYLGLIFVADGNYLHALDLR